MLNFSKLKIFTIIIFLIFSTYIFLGNFNFFKKTNLFLDKNINLGLDLQGGSYLLLEIDIQPLKIKKLDDKAVEIRKILREENINYKNFNIAKEGISFEINDIKNKEQTIKLLEGSKTKSDFFDKITGSSQNEKKEIILKIQNLNFNINFSEDFERKIKKDAMSQSLEIVRKRIDQLGTKEPNIQQKGDIRIIVELPGLSDPSTFKNILGKTAQLSFKFLKSSSDILGSEKIKSKIDGSILDVEKRLILSGENLIDAQPGYDQQNKQPIVSFKLDRVGANKFANATKDNVGRPLAIILDNEVISAPVIREPILTGSGQISGNFTTEEANQLAVLLRSGALPAPMKIVEERTVGPDLGEDSIRYGIISFVIGFLLVFIFMIYSYKIFGLFANIALFFNVVILLSLLSLLGATLTLPGIAGVILTVGMAIDANVIIYEKIKDEFKLEKNVIIAFDNAFKKSYLTIIDSNLTTLIAGIILFFLGSGPVKGFAVTLCLGIITSFFTAFTICRLIVSKFILTKKNEIFSLKWN